MMKIELSTHYLIFWTLTNHFHAVQVITRNEAFKVMLSLYILFGQSSVLSFFCDHHT